MPKLIPCRKWRNQSQNLEVGDVVMMQYKGSITDDYRLARVVNVFPDNRGLVRSVRVSYRKKNKREKPEEYRSKPLISENIGVQRLSLLQAAGEDSPTGEDVD